MLDIPVAAQAGPLAVGLVGVVLWLLDDLRNEIQITFYQRRIALIELVLVHVGNGVGPQPLWPVQGVGHGAHAHRVDGLKLIHHGDDAR